MSISSPKFPSTVSASTSPHPRSAPGDVQTRDVQLVVGSELHQTFSNRTAERDSLRQQPDTEWFEIPRPRRCMRRQAVADALDSCRKSASKASKVFSLLRYGLSSSAGSRSDP